MNQENTDQFDTSHQSYQQVTEEQYDQVEHTYQESEWNGENQRKHQKTRHWYVRAHAPTAMARLLAAFTRGKQPRKALFACSSTIDQRSWPASPKSPDP